MQSLAYFVLTVCKKLLKQTLLHLKAVEVRGNNDAQLDYKHSEAYSNFNCRFKFSLRKYSLRQLFSGISHPHPPRAQRIEHFADGPQRVKGKAPLAGIGFSLG